MATLPTTTDIQRDLERTRSSVEQLNRQVSQLTSDMGSLRDDVKSILNHLQSPPPAETMCYVSPNEQWSTESQHGLQQQQPQRSLADNCSVDGSVTPKHPPGGAGSSKKAVNFLPRLHFRSGRADSQKLRVTHENVCHESDELEDEPVSYGDNSATTGGGHCCVPDSEAGFVAPSSGQSRTVSTSDENPVVEQTNNLDEHSGPRSGRYGSESDISVFVDDKECSPTHHRRHLSFLTTDL